MALSATAADDKALASLTAEDRALVDVIRAVDAELEAQVRRPHWRAWLEGLGAFLPSPGLGLGAWLRSPAVAYLVVLAMAYPAYRGLTRSAPSDEATPIVLSRPQGIDAQSPSRSGSGGAQGPAITIEEQGGPTVVTVFVPIDERYRYRLEVFDRAGRSRFRQNDARSFDGYGTFALVLPAEFLTAGDYELRVDELGDDGQPIEVFRFPFEVQR